MTYVRRFVITEPRGIWCKSVDGRLEMLRDGNGKYIPATAAGKRIAEAMEKR